MSGWDGACEAMALLHALPEGSCTKAGSTIIHGLSGSCSSHQCSGDMVVWGTQRTQRIWP